MKRILTIAIIAGSLAVPAGAQAHPLSCAKAREKAGHSSRVVCIRRSPNHIYLWHATWKGSEDHVWQWHAWRPLPERLVNWSPIHKYGVNHGTHGKVGVWRPGS